MTAAQWGSGERMGSRRSGATVLVFAVLVAGAATGGYLAGFTARGGPSASDSAEISASETVTLRFPDDWNEASATPVSSFALASAGPGLALFDPKPIYPVAAAEPTALPEVSNDQPVAAAKPVVAALGTAAKPAAA